LRLLGEVKRSSMVDMRKNAMKLLGFEAKASTMYAIEISHESEHQSDSDSFGLRLQHRVEPKIEEKGSNYISHLPKQLHALN